MFAGREHNSRPGATTRRKIPQGDIVSLNKKHKFASADYVRNLGYRVSVRNMAVRPNRTEGHMNRSRVYTYMLAARMRASSSSRKGERPQCMRPRGVSTNPE